ncbi:MAG: hypothetical protein IJZ22_07020 [Bacteroidaceae bacterium]|nr:hypothetical protein [Bacteroidaceae bacterium]
MTTDELKKGNWVKFNGAFVKVTDIVDDKTVVVCAKFRVDVKNLGPINFIEEEWCVASLTLLLRWIDDAKYLHELQNLYPEFANIDLKIINGEIMILKK